MSDTERLTWREEAIARLSARLDRLEAQIIIQTGTVFGAEGDSERMTIEHEIPPGKEA